MQPAGLAASRLHSSRPHEIRHHSLAAACAPAGARARDTVFLAALALAAAASLARVGWRPGRVRCRLRRVRCGWGWAYELAAFLEMQYPLTNESFGVSLLGCFHKAWHAALAADPLAPGGASRGGRTGGGACFPCQDPASARLRRAHSLARLPLRLAHLRLLLACLAGPELLLPRSLPRAERGTALLLLGSASRPGPPRRLGPPAGAHSCHASPVLIFIHEACLIVRHPVWLAGLAFRLLLPGAQGLIELRLRRARAPPAVRAGAGLVFGVVVSLALLPQLASAGRASAPLASALFTHWVWHLDPEALRDLASCFPRSDVSLALLPFHTFICQGFKLLHRHRRPLPPPLRAVRAGAHRSRAVGGAGLGLALLRLVRGVAGLGRASRAIVKHAVSVGSSAEEPHGPGLRWGGTLAFTASASAAARRVARGAVRVAGLMSNAAAAGELKVDKDPE